jgi:putative nucleotidyltransferase with HDIG domain
MKVLCVEDDKWDSDLIKREMAKNAPDVAVEFACSLQEARKYLEEGALPDVVLADLFLADGTAFDLLKDIRTGGIPVTVVVLTGYGDEGTVVSVLKAGADDYLPKRPGFEKLLPQTLERAFYRFDRERALHRHPLRVLYAEHDPRDIELTRRYLKDFAPHIILDVVTSGAAALERFPESPEEPCLWDVFLLDYRLPGEDTLELLREIRHRRGLDLPVVMITGQGDEEVAAQSLRMGATDYMVKNVDYFNRLPPLIENAYHQASASREKAAYKESESRYKSLFEGLLQCLGKITEIRDPYTSGHQLRVADLAVAIAQKMGLDANTIEGIHAAASLHDIGKLSIPADILTKPAKLTELEYNLVKLHPQTGYEILKDIRFPWPLPEVVYQHHERLDGSGYPRGLKGKAILLESRVLAVADVVEAMSSFRPYRPALDIQEAFVEIRSGAGTKYDPKVVNACIEVFEEGYRFK